MKQTGEIATQGSFQFGDDMLIYVSTSERHGTQLWTRYELCLSKYSADTSSPVIGEIMSKQALTVDELEERARAIYERVIKSETAKSY